MPCTEPASSTAVVRRGRGRRESAVSRYESARAQTLIGGNSPYPIRLALFAGAQQRSTPGSPPWRLAAEAQRRWRRESRRRGRFEQARRRDQTAGRRLRSVTLLLHVAARGPPQSTSPYWLGIPTLRPHAPAAACRKHSTADRCAKALASGHQAASIAHPREGRRRRRRRRARTRCAASRQGSLPLTTGGLGDPNKLFVCPNSPTPARSLTKATWTACVWPVCERICASRPPGARGGRTTGR